MRLPKSFNEVTISQFQECYFILKADPTLEGWARVISILSGEDIKTIENLPVPKIKLLKRKIIFLLDDENLNTKVKKYILVNKRVYKAIYEANKLSVAQAMDIRTFQKPTEGMSAKDTVVENAHKLLASIYLPLKGLSFKYDGANHAKIAEDFRHAKMGDVYGTLFFYSLVYQKLIETSQPFGVKALETIENHMTEVIEWASKKDLKTTGAGS